MTTQPKTAAGRDAVRMRGLFGGETKERTTEWVRRIEADAAERRALAIWNALRRLGPRPIRLSVIQAICLSTPEEAGTDD